MYLVTKNKYILNISMKKMRLFVTFLIEICNQSKGVDIHHFYISKKKFRKSDLKIKKLLCIAI